MRSRLLTHSLNLLYVRMRSCHPRFSWRSPSCALRTARITRIQPCQGLLVIPSRTVQASLPIPTTTVRWYSPTFSLTAAIRPLMDVAPSGRHSERTSMERVGHDPFWKECTKRLLVYQSRSGSTLWNTNETASAVAGNNPNPTTTVANIASGLSSTPTRWMNRMYAVAMMAKTRIPAIALANVLRT